jgi:fumarate reductase subunit D
MLPRLPPDLWFAIAAAVAVLLFGMAEPAGVLVAAYVAMCGYVVFKVFGCD